MHEIDIHTRTDAAPDVVYRLLDDSSSWPDWTPIDTFELVEAPSADGLGEVREFVNGRVTVREQIVERISGRRLTYVLLAGLPLEDYRAEIDVRAEDAGSTVRWHTTFTAKRRGTGWIYLRALRKATQQFVDGLARRADEEAVG